MLISAIVASSKNQVIGKDNKLPWHLPGDLKWFKSNTLNRHIIMGRKSFESLPFALPKRVNIVVTKDSHFFHSHCHIENSIPAALEFARSQGETEAFILGGGTIYEQTKDLWDRLYLTEVQAEFEGDTYFPEIDLDLYDLKFKEIHKKDDKNAYDYTFMILDRKK